MIQTFRGIMWHKMPLLVTTYITIFKLLENEAMAHSKL